MYNATFPHPHPTHTCGHIHLRTVQAMIAPDAVDAIQMAMAYSPPPAFRLASLGLVCMAVIARGVRPPSTVEML